MLFTPKSRLVVIPGRDWGSIAWWLHCEKTSPGTVGEETTNYRRQGPTELTIEQTDSHAKSKAGRIERKDDRQLVTLYRE